MAVKEKVFIIKFMKPMNKKYGQIARFVILNHVGFHVHMVTNLLWNVTEYISEKVQLAVGLCTPSRLSIQILLYEEYCFVRCDAVTPGNNSARRRHIP